MSAGRAPARYSEALDSKKRGKKKKKTPNCTLSAPSEDLKAPIGQLPQSPANKEAAGSRAGRVTGGEPIMTIYGKICSRWPPERKRRKRLLEYRLGMRMTRAVSQSHTHTSSRSLTHTKMKHSAALFFCFDLHFV